MEKKCLVVCFTKLEQNIQLGILSRHLSPVLPVLSLCANVHGQGPHPHWSVWQHVSFRQEEMSPSPPRVRLHMA